MPQILGFFGAGVVLNQFGLIRNITDVKLLSEWGILFLVRSFHFISCFRFMKASEDFAAFHTDC
jgi:hypothetical protein